MYMFLYSSPIDVNILKNWLLGVLVVSLLFLIIGLGDVFYRLYKKDKEINPLWILGILIFPILGSIIYFITKNKKNEI